MRDAREEIRERREERGGRERLEIKGLRLDPPRKREAPKKSSRVEVRLKRTSDGSDEVERKRSRTEGSEVRRRSQPASTAPPPPSLSQPRKSWSMPTRWH